MNPNIQKASFESLDLTEPVQVRVATITAELEKLCPEEVKGAFISERVQQDGNRSLESLWLFSDNYFMEAKTFLSSDDLDLLYVGHMDYIHITKERFAFGAASDTSRITLNFQVGASALGTTGTLNASGKNCDQLVKVMNQFILPHLKH